MTETTTKEAVKGNITLVIVNGKPHKVLFTPVRIGHYEAHYFSSIGSSVEDVLSNLEKELLKAARDARDIKEWWETYKKTL